MKVPLAVWSLRSDSGIDAATAGKTNTTLLYHLQSVLLEKWFQKGARALVPLAVRTSKRAEQQLCP